jgi:hypothetical protein
MAGINLGVHETETTSAKRAAAFPGHTATRIFVPGVQSKPFDLVTRIERQCGPTWADGHIAAWSIKPHPKTVADGGWRKPFEDLAAYLKDNYKGKRTIVIIWHEPENDLHATFKTPEDFTRMFNTVDGWMRKTWSGTKTCHAALAYAYRDKRGFTDADARRWRTNAKVHGVDVYSGRSFPLSAILPEHTGFARWAREVARIDQGGRWAVTERGWTCSKQYNKKRADTIRREFQWLATQKNQPDTYLLWNSTGTENDAGLILDPAGRQAVADGFKLLGAS